MSGFVRNSRPIWRGVARALVAGAALFCAAPVAGAEVGAGGPRRVVSINLCTDQLAMMLAAEGQLVSVSRIAADPNVSPMAEQARGYVINHGQAEEIYMLDPDLVLAGAFTPRHTVDMLENLGIRVEVFDITTSVDGVRGQLRKMGTALHRQAAASEMIAEFDARLAQLRRPVQTRPSAMLYYANGYTSGEQTLANDILDLAGFRNSAIAAGYEWGMKMPLEVLALSNPDLVITTQPYPGGSRAEDVMIHPAVRALRASRAATAMTDSDWVCGTPFVLRAAERLAQVRRAITGEAR